MRILYTTRFAKRYKKLPEKIKDLAEKKEKIFRKDPHDLRLRTHSLGGKFVGKWAFSINRQYRVIFKYISNDEVLLLTVGTHEIYK